MNSTIRSSEPNKNPNIVQVLIYAVFILAVIAIAAAIGAFYEDPAAIEITLFLLAIGLISMSLAGYILFQSRKRISNLKIEVPKIITTIECRKCNIKTTREFQRGDYVFKELDNCPKCEDTQIITAIYREAKEKEKEKPANV